jgi:hypothetical protein
VGLRCLYRYYTPVISNLSKVFLSKESEIDLLVVDRSGSQGDISNGLSFKTPKGKLLMGMTLILFGFESGLVVMQVSSITSGCEVLFRRWAEETVQEFI